MTTREITEAPPSEVGASLTDHMATQQPQDWPPELIRNDVPAYVHPEDRPAWLPVAEGSQWVWSGREDKAIVEVLSVEGPSPESMATIKVPFSTESQRWPAKDFGPGQKFEPLPSQPPATSDLFAQAREWLAMVHPYPSLEERNDHGMELAQAIALEIGCEYTPPEGLSGARLADAIAKTFAEMLEPAVVIEPEQPKGKKPPSNEWYLPAEYAQAVRDVLGTIDLDPASCELANETIQAARFYTIETDGFDKPWPGRVYLNPPYNDGGSARWSARLIEQYKAGITEEAILLINASTERSWFKPFWSHLICFTDHRIAFYEPNGERSQPRYGNAFVYLGPNPERFREVFEQFGAVVGSEPPAKPAQAMAEPQTLEAFRAARDRHQAEADRLTARMREMHEAERAQVLAQLAALDQKAEEMGLTA